MNFYQTLSHAAKNCLPFLQRKKKDQKIKKSASSSNDLLIARFRQEIEQTRSSCAASTHDNKVTAVNTFERFCNRTMKGQPPITTTSITSDHIKAFERWALDEDMRPNYVALHMRCLRSLINRINGKGNELFKHVRTTRCQTEKRAVNEETVRKIKEIKDELKPKDVVACNIFLFCFYGMGIPLIDAVYLKKSQLKNGTITYYRHKTKRQVTITIEPVLQKILEEMDTSNSPYLLPILTKTEKQGASRQYHAFYQRYSRALVNISKLLGKDVHLTSYTPRHSWASIAYKKGVDINTIARALGHANTNITYSYIREIDDHQLEIANRIVCSTIL